MSEANGNQEIIEEFRASGGKVGGWFEGAPMLLLHTIGAKSGLPRVNPLMYQQVGDDLAVFASKAGAPTNPDWFYNLRANPNVEIELGTETIPSQPLLQTTMNGIGSGGSRRRGIPPLPSTRRQQRDGRSQSSSSPARAE